MKRIILGLITLGCALLSMAQESTQTEMYKYQPKFYMGISSGINNMTGLIGAHADFIIADNFILEAGVGIGGWGYKLTANFQYHPVPFTRWFYKLGYSYSSGLTDFTTKLETVDQTNQNVLLDLLPANNINLSIGHSWQIGKESNRFYLEGGYSINIDEGEYFKVKSPGVELSPDAVSLMELEHPGGIIIALGFAFGVD